MTPALRASAAAILAALLAAGAPGPAPAQDAEGETAPLRRLSAEAQMAYRGVGRLDFGDGYCTATLFDARHALTAAHCLFDRQGRRRPTAEMWFRAGLRGEGEQALRQVRRAAAHPDYRWNGPRATAEEIAADVALLELDQPLLTSAFPSYAPAALPAPGGAVAVLGYGAGRDAVLSMQSPCRVLARRGAGARLDCEAAPGASGSPVLVRRDGALRLAGVISARGRGVSFASAATDTLPRLHRALAALSPGRKSATPGGGLSALSAEPGSGRKVSRPPSAD